MTLTSGAVKTSIKFTAAVALISSIKAKHSVLTKDPDVLYQYLDEHSYTWHARGAKWIKRAKK
jgi:hypothetical protein